jgi:ribosomal protein S18 acetylase RimI-like enzyme
MKRVCEIRPAAVEHAEAIVSAVRDGFDSRLLELFIYGCDGIVSFVAEEIAIQDRGGDAHFTVAFVDGELAACVELKRFPQSLFLNYIAVRPAFRSRGLARQVLHEAIAFAGTEGRREMVLDVLIHNAVPREWYERLGFLTTGCTTWWTMPLTPGPSASVLIRGYPQAEACQRAFGFSMLNIAAEEHEYTVGRLGTQWYRFTNPAALNSPGVLAALTRLDASRRILLLTPETVVPSPQAELVAQSSRMVVDLDTLQAQLSNSRKDDRSV